MAQTYKLDEIFAWYDRKYGALSNNVYTLVKALGYFDDAEDDEMPEMLMAVTWEQVKSFLLSESLRLGKTLL